MSTDTTERLTQRPIAVLHASSSKNSNNNESINQNNTNLLHLMATATDKEGFTPLQLMGQLQRSELKKCRDSLQAHQPHVDRRATTRLRPRQASFSEQGDDGVDFFSENSDLLRNNDDSDGENSNTSTAETMEYACEVVTFGRPGHYALGVGVSSSSSSAAMTTENSQYSHSASTFSTQRVQEFAQETVGRRGAAVAVAAATHHTLVVTKHGHLYAFGLGKGGRLGLGEEFTQQCPLPKRVLGPLNRRLVVNVAAAENHSLCVTRDGSVFSWGSNRFGQLGDSGTTAVSSAGGNRSVPRRVEDMKPHHCVAVAAGERHSVALTLKGEVYVWGDNTCGQLGVPRRSGTQKVQRVEALWKASTAQGNRPKIAIAIAASDQSTLVLIGSAAGGLTNTNSIYEWGHGNHVPMRVHFESSRSKSNGGSNDKFASRNKRVVNPIAIACGRYHNATISSDGLVYTWGLHAESLGRSSSSNTSKQQQRRNSLPQIVSGILAENGGGSAVAIAASDHRTAVVCDNGALFTWGTTDGKNVLGHEGVRFQHLPRQVPGVHRAVNVAIGKEHTVLLIGATFPLIPKAEGLLSLDLIAARNAAKHVDLFNVIPISVMAERAECSFLTEFCSAFIQRNLDGVLNMGKKSILNQYLNDMIADSVHRSGKRYRDGCHHPFIYDVLSIGNDGRPTFTRDLLSNLDEWALGCSELMKRPSVQKLLEVADAAEFEEDRLAMSTKKRRTSSCGSEGEDRKPRARSISGGAELAKPEPVKREGSLDACIKRTANMDLSTTQLANENSAWLSKEIRGVRKKLKQISHLLETEAKSIVLTTEQKAKVDRQPVLEAELTVYESALEEVKRRIQDLHDEEAAKKQKPMHGTPPMSQVGNNNDTKVSFADDSGEKKKKLECDDKSGEESKEEKKTNAFFCEICNVKCSDKSSLVLHQNGRKHRNKCAQVAQEEEKKTAVSILQHQQRAQMDAPARFVPPAKEPKKNAWGTAATPPKFKLPPPPHHPSPQVPRRTPGQSPWETKGKPRKGSMGSPAIVSPGSNFQRMLATSKNSRGTPTKSPVWDSSPGSSRCVPLNLYEAPDLNSVPPQRSTMSIADFLTPKKPPPACPSAAPWQSPKAAKSPSSKTIMQIQEEEANLKAREDKASGSKGGQWYVERRERASSLLEIQKGTEAEEEERLMIEEQYRIEAQIVEENQRFQNEQEKQQSKSGPRRGNKKPQRRSGGKQKKCNGGNAKASNKPKASSTAKAQV